MNLENKHDEGPKNAVVLFSGGLDSTVALAIAVEDNPGKKIHALTVDYGSKHNQREIVAAVDICLWYEHRGVDVYRHPLNLQGAFAATQRVSALMGDNVEMPHQTYEEILASEGPSPAVVPYRNGVLLSHAALLAASVGAGYVYAGMHSTDAHNFAYPDCTWNFLAPQGAAIFVGTYGEVCLRTPFISDGVLFTKEQVCMQGIELNAPLHLTWSCYEGREHHCGLCPTCIERLQAFKAAGYADPRYYEIEEPDFWGGAPYYYPEEIPYEQRRLD